MSDTPPPVPPLPAQPAAEAAATGPTPASPAYDPAQDPDDTGVPTSLHGEIDDIGRGFFRALFDISFRTFITRRLASVFYLVGLVAIGIGFIYYFFSGIIRGIMAIGMGINAGAGISLIIATLILVPIISFLAIITLRFVIEGIVALIAIAENTERTAEHTRRSTV